MVSRFLIACTTCILIISCTDKNNDFYKSPLNDEDLELTKIDEFIVGSSADSTNTIGKLRFTFATNPAGSLHAFYDEIKKRFLVTNSEGEIQTIISEEGRGPGEIIKADGFNFDNQNNLVVFDQNQLMVKVFDTDGTIVSHAKPEKSSYYISGRKLHIYKGNIVSATMDQRLLGNIKEEAYKSKLAAIHSYDGKLVDTVGVYDPSLQEEPKSYNLFPIVNLAPEEHKLISTHYHNYRIQLYNLNTEKRIAWFGRKTQHFKEGKEYISSNLPREKVQDMSVGRSSAVSVHWLSNYIVLYFETLTEDFFETENFNKKESYLAVYNGDNYHSYGDIKLPYVLGNVANDKLYLIENDNPDNFTVGVYELIPKN